MAAGKPVIASNVSGLAEIVKGYGLLFETGDADELASKVLSLQDDDLFQELSEHSLQRCQDFSVQSMVDNMLKLYIHKSE